MVIRRVEVMTTRNRAEKLQRTPTTHKQLLDNDQCALFPVIDLDFPCCYLFICMYEVSNNYTVCKYI